MERREGDARPALYGARAKRWARWERYRRLVVAMARSTAGFVWGDAGGGLRYLYGAVHESGASTRVAVPRAIPETWMVDSEAIAQKVASCGVAWSVGMNGSVWGARPILCGSAWCPVCSANDLLERQRSYAAGFAVYANAGHRILFRTLTQPQVSRGSGEAVIVCSDVYRRLAESENICDGVAVAGEGLGVALDRFNRAQRRILDDKIALVEEGGRWVRRYEWMRKNAVAGIDAIEVTQVNRRTLANRWHVHSHSLIVLGMNADIEPIESIQKGERLVRYPSKHQGGMRDVMVEAWCDESKGTKIAQDMQIVEPDIAAISEVVKYSGKIPDMTWAGWVEYMATMIGTVPVRRVGAMHGNTKHFEVKDEVRADAAAAMAGESSGQWADLESYGSKVTVRMLREAAASGDRGMECYLAYGCGGANDTVLITPSTLLAEIEREP